MKTIKTLFFTLLLFTLPNIEAADRRSSAPFISGDTFRAHCDFLYDETSRSFKPSKVKNGDVIFVKSDYISDFFHEKHPKIKSRYIIVSHNSDDGFPGGCARFLDDHKIIAWFGQNIDGTIHPKAHPIPIGIANRYWSHGDINVVQRVADLAPKMTKNTLLYLNFQIGTYPTERSMVAQMFKDKPYCTNSGPKGYMSYLSDIAQSKFVLCPRGNGLDCHRTWECLLMGAFPIVRTSPLDPMFENMPVLIINDWSEINEDFLHEKYAEMQSKSYQMEKAYADYWLMLIDGQRNNQL